MELYKTRVSYASLPDVTMTDMISKKLATLRQAGKTDGGFSGIESTTDHPDVYVAERFWIDEASAQEWIDWTMANIIPAPTATEIVLTTYVPPKVINY
jgi:hypothetical protein